MTPVQRFALWIATLQAWVAVASSLVLSNALYFPPCDLCWWQRIFFYPLAVLFPIALYRRDVRGALAYGTPLAVLGWLTALYHVLLERGVVTEGDVVPCGISGGCSTPMYVIEGLLTIPMLSLAGFTVVLLCMLPLARRGGVGPTVAASIASPAPTRAAAAKRRAAPAPKRPSSPKRKPR